MVDRHDTSRTNRHDIPGRMKDYFERQIGWFEKMLEDLATLEEDLDASMPDDASVPQEVVQRQEAHEKGMRALEDEFISLLHEWEVTESIGESARKEVRALAREAEALSNKLQSVMGRGAELAAERMASLEVAFGQIRQGKTMVEGYRTGGAADASYVDRKA